MVLVKVPDWPRAEGLGSAVIALAASVVWLTVTLVAGCDAGDEPIQEERAQCYKNSDCSIGKKCEAGLCSAITCASDDDCPGQSRCQSGLCGPYNSGESGVCDAPGMECQEDDDCGFYAACVECSCVTDPGCQEPHWVKITEISPSADLILASDADYEISVTAEYHVPTEWDGNRSTAEIYVAAIKGDGAYEVLDRDWVWFGSTRKLPGGDFTDFESRSIHIPPGTVTLKLMVTFVACGHFPEAEVIWQVF